MHPAYIEIGVKYAEVHSRIRCLDSSVLHHSTGALIPAISSSSGYLSFRSHHTKYWKLQFMTTNPLLDLFIAFWRKRLSNRYVKFWILYHIFRQEFHMLLLLGLLMTPLWGIKKSSHPWFIKKAIHLLWIFLLGLKVFIKGLLSEKKHIINKSKHTPRTIFKFDLNVLRSKWMPEYIWKNPKKYLAKIHYYNNKGKIILILVQIFFELKAYYFL